MFPDFVFGECAFAEVQDQRCLPLVHSLFKAALIEWPPKGVEPVGIAPATKGDKTGTTLQSRTRQYFNARRRQEKEEGRRQGLTKKAAAAMPTPTATVDAMKIEMRW